MNKITLTAAIILMDQGKVVKSLYSNQYYRAKNPLTSSARVIRYYECSYDLDFLNIHDTQCTFTRNEILFHLSMNHTNLSQFIERSIENSGMEKLRLDRISIGKLAVLISNCIWYNF